MMVECACVCPPPPPCLVSCTEQLPRESPCQKPRQNIKTCNTFCITVTHPLFLFLFFLVTNFKNKNPFSSCVSVIFIKEKQDKTIEIYFSKKKEKTLRAFTKDGERRTGWFYNQYDEIPTNTQWERWWAGCVCVSSSSARIPGIDPFPQLTPAVLSVAEFFFSSSPSIHPPTQNKKVEKSMRIKVGLFFPFFASIRSWMPRRHDGSTAFAMMNQRLKDMMNVVQLRATRSLHDGWSSPTEKKKEKMNLLVSLSVRPFVWR